MFTRKFSSRTLTWLLRFYPPLLFGGIWVQEIDKDFRSTRVKIRKTLLNINAAGTLFGGALYMATDPFYVLMFYLYFNQKGYTLRAWLKSGHIDYIKPVKSSLVFYFDLSLEDFDKAEKALKENGRFVGIFKALGKNKEGEIYVTMDSEVYLRDLNYQKPA